MSWKFKAFCLFMFAGYDPRRGDDFILWVVNLSEKLYSCGGRSIDLCKNDVIVNVVWT